jgi:hypothetical protein
MPMQFVSSHCDYWMKEGKDGMDVDGVLQAPSTNGIRMNDDEEGGNDDEHLYYYTITIGNRMSRIQPLSTTLRSTLQSLRSTNISRPKNNVRSHLQSRFSSSYNSTTYYHSPYPRADLHVWIGMVADSEIEVESGTD